ncbi:hypothetical protein [Labilibaculum euxinus]|uniref:Uncharacterized protein n=1 Tax=Labilibaculum euxinus TaxID=2686357 RepID=A0A7M4DB46_9BACT|nr:hypothetical protein [Labilibaculum euxinus]MUP39875.1 hypothetical protein [Labilibaculum euxinus]MVB09080.1 hypothetical protein [Labilibaculum euxinus]
MKNTKKTRVTLWVSAISLLTVIIICTVNVITITKEPILFSIDFENKHQIISSYGVLIGAILTFLSIIFVLYNIIQQQSQYENDKALEQQKNDNQLLDRLKLFVGLTNEVIKNISQTGSEMKKFYLAESKSPLLGNFLQFVSDKSYYRILELDYLTNYQSFQRYLGEEKESDFITIYNTLDFYGDSIKELQDKMSSYLDKKQNDREGLGKDLKAIIDTSVKVTSTIKRQFPNEYEKNEWYKLFNNLVLEYYAHLREDKRSKTETDLTDFNNNLLKEFVERHVEIISPKYTELIDEVGHKVADLRKDIEALKQYCTQMASSIKERHEEYFIETSKTFVKLNSLKSKLEQIIEKTVGDNLV